MIFGAPRRSKASWHLCYWWGKTPKKPHPGNLSNPGPLHDKRACYHLLHSGGLWHVKKWPRTESLNKSLPHPVSEGAEGDKNKMPFSVLCRQWPEENFFKQMKISSILRKFSISILTELMPQYLEKLVTRAPRVQRDHHPASVTVLFGSVIRCHHQAPFLWKRDENLCQSLWEHCVGACCEAF